MWQHCIYLHRKASTLEPFYIGKGKLHKGRHDRPFAKIGRSKIWQRTVSKHGLIVEIIASCVDDLAAQELECQFIKELGRRDLGLGPLINLTDGGDGHAGVVASAALRKKRSENSRGPRSADWIASIRKARKNGGNGGVVKTGDKLPDWWKQRISVTKLGAKNPMYGKVGAAHPNSRKVKDMATGEIYESVLVASEVKSVKMKTLYNWLSGHRPNPTTLEFA